MRRKFVIALASTGIVAVLLVLARMDGAAAIEPDHYTVYCAAGHIEISTWDLEQMKVRRGLDVCQFTSYTSSSDAERFATKNFGGKGASCTC